jgi:hypothetical protein
MHKGVVGSRKLLSSLPIKHDGRMCKACKDLTN